jgi:hypothetical protein
MIEQAIINEWKKSIEGFVVNDIRYAVENDKLETGLIILTCAGVDCLGGYFTGKQADREPFTKFVVEFFPDVYKSYADDIYDLRNKLVHDHIIHRKFIANRNQDEAERHLQPCRFKGQDRIWFNRYAFANDFLNAWGDYLERVSTDVDTYTKMVKRADTLGFPQVMSVNFCKKGRRALSF